MNQRKIIHIDMDAFYASIEQRDNKSLKGKPVAVGSDQERGVISAASYEARKFGVKSAMSSMIAKKLCPQLTFVKGDMSKYRLASKQIMEIFHEYTDLVEPLSIDEAFLDVTHNKKGIKSATEIAKRIKQQIKEKTELTASAGLSINKFLAKIASDLDKPNGLYIIHPNEVENFIDKLPVEKFFGVGQVTAQKMHKIGIHTGKDLKALSLEELTNRFGKNGEYFYAISRGKDKREVNPSRERKSVGTEYTFDNDLRGNFSQVVELYKIEQEQFERMKKNDFFGYTLTLKIKFSDFTQITKSLTKQEAIDSFEKLHAISKQLYYTVDFTSKAVRLIGLSVSNLHKNEIDQPDITQLTLNF